MCFENVCEAEMSPERLRVSIMIIVRRRAASVRLHVAFVWPGFALSSTVLPSNPWGCSAPNASTYATITLCLIHVSIKIHIQAACAPRFSLASPLILSIMLTRLSNDAGPPQDLPNHPHPTDDKLLNGNFSRDTSDHHPESAYVPPD